MKVVILAGGFGTRISEESSLKPKPMIEIGGKPILWHIMKIYSNFGLNEFIICCGYKGYIIKEYFANYFLHMSDVTINMEKNSIDIHSIKAEPWKVTLIDTGERSMTGGRLLKVKEYLGNSTFCFTYGDGLSNLDINKMIKSHKKKGLKATVTAVQPPGRFGSLKLENDLIKGFQEKPQGDGGWINGGFFVLEPEVLELIDNYETVWEKEPMELLAKENQLGFYKHNDFWHPMDTLRDKKYLEKLWESGIAPWKLWE